ncbi:MAG TPA: hypothetical protein VFU88_19570 [Ktedonobacterales bacterium]|nr:hypothetical protein [Ktedonobacterales bacterium]
MRWIVLRALATSLLWALILAAIFALKDITWTLGVMCGTAAGAMLCELVVVVSFHQRGRSDEEATR